MWVKFVKFQGKKCRKMYLEMENKQTEVIHAGIGLVTSGGLQEFVFR